MCPLPVAERTPIPYEEALAKIMAHVPSPKPVEVPLAEAAGRVFLDTLVADFSLPPFRRAGADGFAIRSRDVEKASPERPVRLRIVAELAAGRTYDAPLGAGEAVRLMTGTAFPEGADTLLRLEDGEVEGDTLVVRRSLPPGRDVFEAGEDIRQGEVLLRPGDFLTPGAISVLATFGRTRVRIGRRPRIGILVTGDELLAPDEPLVPGKIRESNSFMLGAQVAMLGMGAHVYGVVPDERELLYARVRSALEEVDVLITTGGVAVGDYDLIPETFRRVGGEILFDRLAFRPGQLTTVAHVDGRMLFGLSGNPGAAFVGFHIFVRPYVLAYMGLSPERALHPRVPAVLEGAIPGRRRLPVYARGCYRWEGGRIVARTLGPDSSSYLSTLVRANALLYLPAGEDLPAGTEVETVLLDVAPY